MKGEKGPGAGEGLAMKEIVCYRVAPGGGGGAIMYFIIYTSLFFNELKKNFFPVVFVV